MASIRQSIIDAVTARLETILIVNSYQTNIGEKVTEWQAYDPDADDLECIMIRDIASKVTDPEEEDDNVPSYHYKNLNLNVFVLTHGATTPVDLRKMIADVLKAVGTDDTWGGLAIRTSLDGDETQVEQEKRKVGGTRIDLFIKYKVPKWQD